MRIEAIKDLSPEVIKEKLNESGISIRDLAEGLKINHSIVSQVIHNKYTGSEETINKVWERIAFVLESKEDLNPILYNNAELYVKLLQFGIKDRRFNNDETKRLIDTANILTNYIEKQKA